MSVITGSVSRNASRYTYRLVCDEINLDSTNNTSQLQVAVQIVTGGTTGTTYAVRSSSASHTVTVDGVSYTFVTNNYSLIGGQTITLGTIVSNPITHNNDGTKTVTVSASSPDLAQGNGYGPYSGSASGSVTLTTLHKAPTITGYTITEQNADLISAGIANDVFVQDLSKKSFNITAVPDGSATIDSYLVWNFISRNASTTNPVVIDFSQKALRVGDITPNKVAIAVGAVDNQGAGTTYPSSDLLQSDEYNAILYTKISITDVDTYVKRKGQLSGRVNLNIKGSYYNGSVGNKNQGGTYKPTIKYKFWKVGDSEPSTFNYTVPSGNITVNNGIFTVTNYDIGSSTESDVNYFNPDYAYRVKVFVQDYFKDDTSSEKPVPVGEAAWTEYKDRVDFKKITVGGYNPFKYSTTEKKVGIWIDGRPVYSITIETTNELSIVADTWNTIDNVSTLNIDMIIDCKIMNNKYSWYSHLTRVDSNNLQIYGAIPNGAGWGGKFFTILYTKTTDL